MQYKIQVKILECAQDQRSGNTPPPQVMQFDDWKVKCLIKIHADLGSQELHTVKNCMALITHTVATCCLKVHVLKATPGYIFVSRTFLGFIQMRLVK